MSGPPTVPPSAPLLTSPFDSPIGTFGLAADEDGTLVRVTLPGLGPLPDGRRSDAVLAPALDAFGRYFAGEPPVWAFRYRPAGSPFQRRVWAALEAIPYGETRSYGAVAGAVGCPGAARAVGAANRANPLPVVIPCHRVLAADGALTGYAGRRGLDIKRYLLDLESAARLPLG